jgi:hypothetical protein
MEVGQKDEANHSNVSSTLTQSVLNKFLFNKIYKYLFNIWDSKNKTIFIQQSTMVKCLIYYRHYGKPAEMEHQIQSLVNSPIIS